MQTEEPKEEDPQPVEEATPQPDPPQKAAPPTIKLSEQDRLLLRNRQLEVMLANQALQVFALQSQQGAAAHEASTEKARGRYMAVLRQLGDTYGFDPATHEVDFEEGLVRQYVPGNGPHGS